MTNELAPKAAAFFDLDRTIISGSSVFTFGYVAYTHGLLPRAELMRDLGSALIFMGPRLAKRAHLGRMFALGLLMFGAGFIGMVFSGSFWGFIPAGFGVGGVGFANIAIVTMRQRLSPPEMLGRVVAASRTISWSLIPLGAALGGAMADWIGVLPVYVIGSAGVIATALAVMRTEVWSGPGLNARR